MKPNSKNNANYGFSLKAMVVIAIVLGIVVAIGSSFKVENDTIYAEPANINKDSIESAQAFLQVYKVLMSPRCMNCHPAGDQPLQGDDSHIHTMNVQRGMDGKGLYAAKCSNCHQRENVPGLHTPPGNPKWQLPPPVMKMIFEGRSAHDLALQIMDPTRNGQKNKKQLLEHARDTLVKAGWAMGEGRTPPPLAYQDFLKVWDTWINKGGYRAETLANIWFQI